MSTMWNRIACITAVTLLLVMLWPLGVTPKSSWTGRVVLVADGDTLEVQRAGQPVRLRLAGVDAPERNQAYGDQARKFVTGLCRNQIVTVIPETVDQYNRTVARVVLPDGRSLNEELLRAGLAWHYRHYSHSLRLAGLEEQARAAHRGLWSDPAPIPPWEYRHGGHVEAVGAGSDTSGKPVVATEPDTYMVWTVVPAVVWILAGLGMGLTRMAVFYRDYGDLGLSLAVWAGPALAWAGRTWIKGAGLPVQALILLFMTGLGIYWLGRTHAANGRRPGLTLLVTPAKLFFSFLFLVHLINRIVGAGRIRPGFGRGGLLALPNSLMSILVRSGRRPARD